MVLVVSVVFAANGFPGMAAESLESIKRDD
jgi:uncharacterized membrane protein YtjA (UPF0391 family)